MNRFRSGKHEGITWARVIAGWRNFRIEVYLYLVNGVLIDTGPVKLSAIILPFLDQQDIEAVLLTHYHEDHSGNAPYLRNRGIPVYVNPSAVERCRDKTRLPMYRKIFWGNRKAFSPQPLDGKLVAGSLTFMPVPTTGHVFDHRSFYLPEKGIFFTGDLFVTRRPRMVLNTENTPRMIEDLKTVLSYDFSTIFCGHAGLIHQGREALQEKLDYLQDIQGKVLHYRDQGLNVPEITRKISLGKAHLKYLSFKEWAPEHMVRSIITGKATAENPRPRT